MNAGEGYICAFPGRRDGYEAPAALVEGGRLELFLTDFYWSGLTARAGEMLLPARLRPKARTRAHPLIPDARVRVLWGSSLRRRVDEWAGRPAGLRYAWEGIRFAEAARDEARRRRAHLFLYPPCSHEAFTAAYPGRQPRRVLFQFHPHGDTQDRLLGDDLAKHPHLARSFHEETGDELPDALRRRDRDSWRDADLIICASGFTRQTLLAAGADPARCRVVPYGTDDPVTRDDEGPAPPGFHALFVGTGSQRKGLHHLLEAWRTARLPPESSLTVVARRYDPGLVPALAASPRTVLLSGGVGAGELAALYAQSTLFVMPSLIEGFGAVFLEAMRHGCPVLGTSHTCLPDLGTEADGVFLTPVGDPPALAARLEALAASLPGQSTLRQATAARATTFSWAGFRHGLLRALDQTATLSPA